MWKDPQTVERCSVREMGFGAFSVGMLEVKPVHVQVPRVNQWPQLLRNAFKDLA